MLYRQGCGKKTKERRGSSSRSRERLIVDVDDFIVRRRLSSDGGGRRKDFGDVIAHTFFVRQSSVSSSFSRLFACDF